MKISRRLVCVHHLLLLAWFMVGVRRSSGFQQTIPHIAFCVARRVGLCFHCPCSSLLPGNECQVRVFELEKPCTVPLQNWAGGGLHRFWQPTQFYSKVKTLVELHIPSSGCELKEIFFQIEMLSLSFFCPVPGSFWTHSESISCLSSTTTCPCLGKDSLASTTRGASV